ncbi:hypothetical protein G9U51_13640 [Calidifontibacter sp. DB0510]|uniref:Type I restriction modification DNA specificity domain-containing protein n=1 Tax=Metallococcus carri TaxID=1656884 RepID=A0A967B762_9MICO|nr:restriction endonuclease subunit S [Metallococcus carri]NHN56817.1 hypothetical protein [Metallococcus carri]NOP37806.1 hypothetical protein [Calidifontibacter sp. DB2511S]
MSEVPAGWSESALGDVCDVVSGATPKTGVAEFWGGDIAWLTPADMSRDRSQTLHGGERGLTEAGLRSCSARLVPPGSVIVSSRAPVGYVAIAGREMCTNQGCKTAVPPEFIEPKYLYWHMLAAKPDLESRASGTTFKEISAKRFAETRLRWPDRSEQRRIVEVLEDHLSRLDAAADYVSAATARLSNLDEASLRQQLAHVAFEQVPFGEALSIPLSNGRSVPTREGGFPVLRLTALQPAGVDLSARKGGAWSEDDARPFLVAKDDYLIARGNGSIRLVGRGSLVRSDPDPIAFPDTAIRARPNEATLSTEYLDLVWNSRSVRRQIESMARTTAGIYKVNQKQLASVLLPVPSLRDQAAITERLTESREQAAGLANSIALAQRRTLSLRRSILAAAFCGKLTGRHTDDEAVEELAEAMA